MIIVTTHSAEYKLLHLNTELLSGISLSVMHKELMGLAT